MLIELLGGLVGELVMGHIIGVSKLMGELLMRQ
jgi:hypothetical protein